MYLFVCPSGSVSRELLPPALPFPFVCFFSFCLSLHCSTCFPLCSLSFWPPFFICFSQAFLFSFPVLCPFPSVSISLDFSLLLLRCSSVALFIHSHSLPCCHFCLFVFCAFLIFFYLSCLHGGLTETQTHMGAHTYCM